MTDKHLIQAHREAYAKSFYLFFRNVITPYYHVDKNIMTERIHKPICDYLQRSNGDGNTRSSNIPAVPLKNKRSKAVPKRRKLLLVPRNCLKTTIAIAYAIWRLVYNPYWKVNLSGYNSDRVQAMLFEMMGHFENNPFIHKIYGNFCSAGHDRGMWKQTKIQLYNPYKNQMVPFQNVASVTTSGLRTGKTGNHVNLALIDDSVCDRNVSSVEQLKAPLTHLKLLQPIVDNEMVVTGTRYDFRDAYQHLIDRNNWDIYLRSAYEPDGSLWFPEHLSEEYLAGEREEMGPYHFACQYMLTPVHPDEATFQTDWIEGCQVDRSQIPEALRIYVYVDPAAGTTRQSDHTAILVVGMDPNNTMWVLQDTKRKMKPKDVITSMIDHYESWGAEVIRCEENVLAAFIEPTINLMADKLKVDVHYEPFSSTTTKSKPARISALYRWIETARIKIPHDCFGLLDEMSRYQNRKDEDDDLLDALAKAAEDLMPARIEKPAPPIGDVIRELRKKQDHVDYLAPDVDNEADNDFINAFM